jgi:hypothetical protein
MLCALAMVLLLLALHPHFCFVDVAHVSHIVGVAIIFVHTSCMPSVGILHISSMLGVVHLGCVLHMPIVALFSDFFFNLVCNLQFMFQFLYKNYFTHFTSIFLSF